MLFRIDPGRDQPLFEQIAGAVRAQIADGTVTSGQRLPSAKDLAEQLGVNLHTVLKAYQALRDEGLVELRRGRGAVVAQRAATLGGLSDAVDRILADAGAAGLGVEAVVALMRTRAAAN